MSTGEKPARARILILWAILLVVIVLATWNAGKRLEKDESGSSNLSKPEKVSGPLEGGPPTSPEGGFVVYSTRSGALAGEPPDGETLAAAREHLRSGGVQDECGPYLVWTDATEDGLLAGCRRTVAGLDDVYEDRFGVRPVSRPAEAIFLFEELEAYRAFAAGEGLSSFGYSAHSIPSRGYVAVWCGGRSTDEVLGTMVHELGHVLNRRALGTGLPRWLEEGLADGLGDTASEHGIGALAGAEGARGQLERLRGGYATERVGSIEELLAKGAGEFDRGTVSYDYEQSAFFVRYLLSDPELRDRFRTLLADLAGGATWAPELVTSRLDMSWDQLDRGLESWVEGL